MEFQNLKIKIHKNIAIITLNRPEKLNVLSEEMLLELREYLETAKYVPHNIIGIIISGEGERAFSVGGDIKQMDKLDSTGGRELSKLAQSVFLMIEKIPIPVIACVDGFALGGGCELAMSCDYIYATKTSLFAQPEVKIGLIPGFGGCVRLARFVGLSQAKEMIYSGRQISAEEALRLGLVLQLFDNREKLFDAAFSSLLKIGENSRNAVIAAKKTLSDTYDRPEAEAFIIEQQEYGHLFDHSEKQEGIQAFFEKRKPRFFERQRD